MGENGIYMQWSVFWKETINGNDGYDPALYAELAPVCGEDRFGCYYSNDCVPIDEENSVVCDGDDDCPHGSDELNCDGTPDPSGRRSTYGYVNVSRGMQDVRMRYLEALLDHTNPHTGLRYADDPTVIGADLHNEPHDSACWGCGDASVDWPAAATRAGNAVLAANPNLLIIVEGVGRDVDGSWTWWGGGLRGVADDPVVLEVADRVVYSPHDYPASVAWQNWFGASDYPDNLTSVWDTNWGYIQKQGIAPVLLGEFGTKLETDSDRLWFDEIIAYLDENDMSFAFWSFNPNSGDTGGIVADDWRTPEADKVAALAPLLAQSVGPVPTPTVSPSPSATPTPPMARLTSSRSSAGGAGQSSVPRPRPSRRRRPPRRPRPSRRCRPPRPR